MASTNPPHDLCENLPFFDPVLDEFPAGQVTAVLNGLTGVPHEDAERIYDAVLEQLRAKAELFIRRFPLLKNQVEADDLISEFYRRLLEKTCTESLNDRGHFFGLACLQFNWILLDMLKERTGKTIITANCPSTDTGPATQAARKLDVAEIFDFIEQKLCEKDRDIVLLRCLLELGFREIAELMEESLATTHSRYKAAIERIRRRFDIE